MTKRTTDTLRPRNGRTFPVCHGMVTFRSMPRASFPSASVFPEGTHIAASDEGGTIYFNKDGDWHALGYGGNVIPSDIMVLSSVEGVPTWRAYASTLTDLGFTVNGDPAVTTGSTTLVSALEVGTSFFSASYSHVLTRVPYNMYRPAEGLLTSEYFIRFNAGFGNFDTNQFTVNGSSSANLSISSINQAITWTSFVRDGVGDYLTDNSYTVWGGAKVGYGIVHDSPSFSLTGNLVSDGFESYTANAAPTGNWTASFAGAGIAPQVKTGFTISTPAVASGAVAAFAGTKFLMLGRLSGTTLQAVSGSSIATLAVDLSAVVAQGVRLNFRKMQKGNDTVLNGGFKCQIVENATGRIYTVLHEETTNTTGWEVETVDLTAWIGQSIGIRFVCYDDTSSANPIAIMIDEVSVDTYNVTPETLYGPGDVNAALVNSTKDDDELMYMTAVRTRETTSSTVALNHTGRVLISYPSDLTPPQQFYHNGHLLNATQIDTISYTNSFGATYNLDIYLSDRVPVGKAFVEASTSAEVCDWWAEVAADDPVVWWKMDGNRASTIFDVSGNNNNATFDYNATTTTLIIYANTEMTDPIIRGTHGAVATANTATTRLLISAASAFNGGPYYNDQYTAHFWYQVPVDSTESFTLHVGADTYTITHGTTNTITGPTGISVSGVQASGEPVLITVVGNGTTAKLYVNGVLVDTGTRSSTAVIALLGVQAVNSVDFVFGEFVMFAKEVSAGRILAHYNAGLL